MTGRSAELVNLVERYSKEQGLFRTDETPDPIYNAVVELDLGSIRPSVAGPRRPQDRVQIENLKTTFRSAYPDKFPATNGNGHAHAGGIPVQIGETTAEVGHGTVAIAAITSCTNTSNPSVMIGAGILAQKAVERGLNVAPYVKTSLAPGSQVVTRYLNSAGLTGYLEALGFHTVGYGCTTCIGNSGPLVSQVAEAVDTNELVVAAVLSGNRNFEGRVHQQVRAAFLASPPLVVAYALAGTVDIDLTTEPLGTDPNGQDVFLADIWPTRGEIQAAISEHVTSAMFQEEYARVFEGDERWQLLPVPTGELYRWDPESTYVQEPPYFIDMSPEPQPVQDVVDARVLVLVGDSVTTDHISPAGSIARTSPAAQYLINNDVDPERLQLVRLPPWQPRRYGPRYVRQHPPQEPVGSRQGRQPDLLPANRRGDEHLRRVVHVSARQHSLDRDCRQGIRLRLFAGLGGQRTDAARHQGGDSRKLRAYPPQQSGRDGDFAAAVQDR